MDQPDEQEWTAPPPRMATQRRDNGYFVREYGEHEPSYGGVYMEGDTLVALFTSDLETHAENLRDRVPAPEGIEVRVGTRTWKQITEANARMNAALHPNQQVTVGVWRSGIGMRDGQFVLTIAIDPYTDEFVERVRSMVAPEEVVIEHGGPNRLV